MTMQLLLLLADNADVAKGAGIGVVTSVTVLLTVHQVLQYLRERRKKRDK